MTMLELHAAGRPGCGETHAAIALTMGLDGVRAKGRHQNPAQRVIFPMIALGERGLVRDGVRRDGLSGGASQLTPEGARLARELRAKGVTPR